jgi:hypothetical protein
VATAVNAVNVSGKLAAQFHERARDLRIVGLATGEPSVNGAVE